MGKLSYDDLQRIVKEMQSKNRFLENELQKKLSTEERIEKLIEQSSDCIIISDFSGKFVRINPSCCKMSGYSLDEFFCFSFYDVLPKEELLRKPLDFDGIKRGNSVVCKRFFEKKNGMRIPVEMISNAISENKIQTIIKGINVETVALDEIACRMPECAELFEDANEMIFSTTLEGNLLYVNSRWCETLGFDKDEILNIHIDDFLDKESIKLFKSKYEKVLKSGKTAYFEAVFLTKNKKDVYVDGYLSFQQRKKNSLEIKGFFHNITKRKLAVEAFRAAELALKTIVNNTHDAIFILNENGKIINFNGKMLEIYEISNDLAYTYDFEDYIKTNEKNPLNAIVKEKINSGDKLIFEAVGQKPLTKECFVAELVLSRIMLNSGNYILANVRDITIRKNAAIKEKKHREDLLFLKDSLSGLQEQPSIDAICNYTGKILENYVENSVILFNLDVGKGAPLIRNVFGINKDVEAKLTRILQWNPIGKSYKYRDDIKELLLTGKIEVFTKGFDEFICSIAPRSVLSSIDRIAKINKIYTIGLIHNQILYGGIYIFTSHSSEIKNPRSIEIFISQFTAAISRKLIEKELIKGNEKLEQVEQLETSFLTNFGHEMRTPLNGIVGFTELMMRYKINSEKQEKYLRLLHQNGKSLNSLVTDIINILEIDRNKLEISKGTININEFLNDLYNFFKAELLVNGKDDIKLIVEPKYQENRQTLIFSDELRLKQIFEKLLGNAIKFTEKGYIKFGYKEIDNSKLLFFVEDTGIGVSKKSQEIIFNRFIQEDSSLTRKYSGVGIGLAISKGLVELLGGKIWIESTQGKGTTFKFLLDAKLKNKASNAHADKEPNDEKINWENNKILIIEDDLTSQVYLSALLEETGVKIFRAVDCKQAFEVFHKNKDIDLILVDIQFPEVRGYAVMKIVNKELRIIEQTSNIEKPERKHFLQAGYDDFIEKPIDKNSLMSIISKFFEEKTKEMS